MAAADRDSTAAAANKLESEADVEDDAGEDKHLELKSSSLRSNQDEAKYDVGPVSTELVSFMSGWSFIHPHLVSCGYVAVLFKIVLVNLVTYSDVSTIACFLFCSAYANE